MSVAVGANQCDTGNNGVARAVTRRLFAWDGGSGETVILDPGAPIGNCRIRRNSGEAQREFGVYIMDFESAGRRLCCPLVQFQARTEFGQLSEEERPARETAVLS